jgi:hypothetical protein
LNLSGNQIQTLILSLVHSLFFIFANCQTCDPGCFLLPFHSSRPSPRTLSAQLRRATAIPSPSISALRGPRVSNLILTKPASTLSRPCAAGLAAPARAGRGRPVRPAGTHAEDRRMRAGLGSTAGKAKDPSAPSPSIRGEPRRRPRAPPALPGGRPRVGGAFPPRAARGSDSKGPGRRGTDAKPPTPSWGFPFHHRPVCTGLGEEAGAPPPRRAGRGRSRTGAGNRTSSGTQGAGRGGRRS